MNQKFEDFIQGDTPVLVDFFNDYSDLCDNANPILKEIKNIVGSSATILKMNIEKNKFYRDKYSVNSVPTILIFKRGKLLWRNSGVASKNEIIRCIAQNVN